MGSYADAKAAVRALLEAEWVTTPIAYHNEVPDSPWPPRAAVSGSAFPQMLPWVFFEMVTMPGQTIRGAGRPGRHVSQTDGLLHAHVMVPSGTSDALATQYAEAIGEIFRASVPYNADGCYLRCWVPRVDEGGDAGVASLIAGIDAGNWFRVTMTVPFQYWHLG